MRRFLVAGLSAALTTAVLFSASLGDFQKQRNIGVNPKKGRTRFDHKSGEYFVTGGGANIWAKTDAFQFAYRRVSGDVTITADVRFEGTGVEAHRKAALMFRQDLTPDSAYADVALHGDGLTSLQYRPAAGAETQEIRSEVKAPGRIRIERHGNTFAIAAGKSDSELMSTGPLTIALHDPVYLGLAVCSHNAGVLETAVFSNVKVESGADRGQ